MRLYHTDERRAGKATDSRPQHESPAERVKKLSPRHVADSNWNPEEFTASAKSLINPIDKERTQKSPKSDVTTSDVERGNPRVAVEGETPIGTALIGVENACAIWGALGLDLDSKRLPYPNVANFIRVLTRYPKFKGRIWFDEFHNRIFQTLLQNEATEMTDRVEIEVTAWLQKELRMPRAGKLTVRDAITGAAMRNVRNEPVEWLNALPWDGIERLPMMLIDGWGAPDSQYIRDIGRCFVVGMVARIYQPGCQLDYLPVFEGVQGRSKSKALRALGGKYHTEMHEVVGSKDFYQGLSGKMLVEFSEMHTLTSSSRDVRRIKGILSNPVDRYRESYGFRAADHPRRCVFAATTNPDDWNNDDTGARRFWPVQVGDINLDYISANREQLFAEGLHRYRAGESWWDFDEAAASEQQDARRVEDPWTNAVAAFVGGRSSVQIDEVMSCALDLPPAQRGMREAKRIAAILRARGWRRGSVRSGASVSKAWMCPRLPKSVDASSKDDF